MDLDKVALLAELRRQRTLVEDGELALLRGFAAAPLDRQSIVEYNRFLEINRHLQNDLMSRMTPDEIAAADRQYIEWFREYLRD